jgi:hypothetical protein
VAVAASGAALLRCACCLTLRALSVRQGGAAALAGEGDGGWALPIGAAVLGVRHVGLGGWQPSECMALENELAAWQRQGNFRERGASLR